MENLDGDIERKPQSVRPQQSHVLYLDQKVPHFFTATFFYSDPQIVSLGTQSTSIVLFLNYINHLFAQHGVTVQEVVETMEFRT